MQGSILGIDGKGSCLVGICTCLKAGYSQIVVWRTYIGYFWNGIILRVQLWVDKNNLRGWNLGKDPENSFTWWLASKILVATFFQRIPPLVLSTEFIWSVAAHFSWQFLHFFSEIRLLQRFLSKWVFMLVWHSWKIKFG